MKFWQPLCNGWRNFSTFLHLHWIFDVLSLHQRCLLQIITFLFIYIILWSCYLLICSQYCKMSNVKLFLTFMIINRYKNYYVGIIDDDSIDLQYVYKQQLKKIVFGDFFFKSKYLDFIWRDMKNMYELLCPIICVYLRNAMPFWSQIPRIMQLNRLYEFAVPITI